MKPCDEWSTFVKIELKETLVELRERFAINDYGGFKNKGAYRKGQESSIFSSV